MIPVDSDEGTVTLTGIADNLVEGDQTIVVDITLSCTTSRTGTASHRHDHGRGQCRVAFQSATTTVGEDGPRTNLTLVLTTAAGNTLENNATIQISAANGTAENADYDASGPFPKTVTFTAG